MNDILRGCVLEAPLPAQLKADQEEAERRSLNNIPPGFKDSGKEDNPYGDYLWWAEVLRNLEGGRPLLVLSNESAKGDWLLKRRGFKVGPLPALANEATTAGASGLLICSTAEVLNEAPRFLGVTVSQGTLEESRSLEASKPKQVVPAEWVASLIGLRGGTLEPWDDVFGLPRLTDGATWRWPEVRQAAMIVRGMREGWSEDLILRAVNALSERPLGRNQLVLTPSTQEWVRSKDLDSYLQDLVQDADEVPIVISWQGVEKKLRIVQAHLERGQDFEPDEE